MRLEGRTLEEFEPLLPAEAVLLQSCRRGILARVGDERPDAASSENKVRASFVRFLTLGGDERAPVHEIIQLGGAFVEGKLNLSGCSVERMLTFLDCTFEKSISTQVASIRGLGLSGCAIPGLNADGLHIFGDILMRQGFRASGPVYLTGSRVEGDIDCTGSSFESLGKVALSLNKSIVEGDVILNRGFRSDGEVIVTGAQIGGSLFCGGGAFENIGGCAISARGLRVGGDVALHSEFRAVGEVRLIGADIGGDLNCTRARFLNPDGRAFNGQGMTIKGGLIWRKILEVEGIVDLTSAAVASLVDDVGSWDKVDTILLDGFRYGRFTGRSPTDAPMRINWLLKQAPGDYGTKFWPSPWEQLAKVFREMGHFEDARLVVIAKQRQMRRARVVGNREPHADLRGARAWLNRIRVSAVNTLARMLHLAYGGLAGYGFRPLRIIGWMFLFWSLAGLTYGIAEKQGLFGPTNPRIYADSQFQECGEPGGLAVEPWTRCASMPPEHTVFDPMMYSLDVILPLIDLRQETDWAPIVRSADGRPLAAGHALRYLMWLEILFGWIGSLLLVSVVGRLIERD